MQNVGLFIEPECIYYMACTSGGYCALLAGA